MLNLCEQTTCEDRKYLPWDLWQDTLDEARILFPDRPEWCLWRDYLVKPLAQKLLQILPGHRFKLIGPVGLSQMLCVDFYPAYLDTEPNGDDMIYERLHRRLYFMQVQGDWLGIRQYRRDRGSPNALRQAYIEEGNHQPTPVPRDATASWFLEML